MPGSRSQSTRSRPILASEVNGANLPQERLGRDLVTPTTRRHQVERPAHNRKVTAYESEGRAFESLRVRHFLSPLKAIFWSQGEFPQNLKRPAVFTVVLQAFLQSDRSIVFRCVRRLFSTSRAQTDRSGLGPHPRGGDGWLGDDRFAPLDRSHVPGGS